jgi:hypothetical protein
VHGEIKHSRRRSIQVFRRNPLSMVELKILIQDFAELRKLILGMQSVLK